MKVCMQQTNYISNFVKIINGKFGCNSSVRDAWKIDFVACSFAQRNLDLAKNISNFVNKCQVPPSKSKTVFPQKKSKTVFGTSTR